MLNDLQDVVDAITETSPEVLIGGLVLAVMLASPLAMIYALSRRRAKDISTLLVAVAALANVGGMAIALGYARRASETPNEAWLRSQRTSQPNSIGPPAPGSPLANAPMSFPMPAHHLPGTPPPSRPRLSDLVAERISQDFLTEGDFDRDGQLSSSETISAVNTFLESSAHNENGSVTREALRLALAEALEKYLRGPGPLPPRAMPSVNNRANAASPAG